MRPEGFPRWAFAGCPWQLFNSSHVRDRDKALLRSILVGGVWNGLLLGQVRRQVIPCRFCGAPDGDGHLFWEGTFLLLVETREKPEFHDLMRMDKGQSAQVFALAWLAPYAVWSGVPGASPWAASAAESALHVVEAALGRYSLELITD